MKKEEASSLIALVLFIGAIVSFFLFAFVRGYNNELVGIIFLVLLPLYLLFSLYTLFFGEEDNWAKKITKNILIIPITGITFIFLLIIIFNFKGFFFEFPKEDFFSFILMLLTVIIGPFLVYKIIRFKKIQSPTWKTIIKVLFIILIIAAILAIIAFLVYFIFLNVMFSKVIQQEKNYYYISMKCYQFCPNKPYYFEEFNYTANKTEGDYVDKPDYSCIMECYNANKAVPYRYPSPPRILSNYFFNKREKEMGNFNYTEYFKCLYSVIEGDKPCNSAVLSSLEKETDVEFIEPVYKSIEIAFQNLSCTQEEIKLSINNQDSRVSHLILVIQAEGRSKNIKKEISTGVQEITVPKSEYESILAPPSYSKNTGQIKVSKVEVSYVVQNKTVVAPFSSRYCDYA